MLNKDSLDTVCGALCYAMGIEPPKFAAAPNETMKAYIDEKLGGKKVDRIFMFNPDAIGQWIIEKYPHLVREVTTECEVAVPLRSPMLPVTPVCFATMYTGAQPEIHGIREYVKPILRIDTIFDAMIRAGKKCAIIANPACSIGNIFLERDVDYYFHQGVDEINATAARLIMEDRYDFIVCYDGNYDFWQHRAGPEGLNALTELRMNSSDFHMFSHMIRQNWKGHNTLLGFAMDHGCHQLDEPMDKGEGKIYWGTHHDDIPEDRNICHYYKIYPAE